MSETRDGLDDLRIPYEKIKFGKKLETQGYGTMFEGEFDNQRVALKQLNITNLANIKPKLLAEILTISRFHQHPNLVALLGFCDEKSNEITLVYEYVASGNLEDKMRKRLTTIQRFEICLGAARGLCYLHSGVESISIVHGNIQLSKILLNSDAKFTAKVSSFGLSKIVPGKGQKVLESSDEDIEKPTEKSDVYSFGVLLLIVLCGVSELVDTDDYQEHHVSELVPKKMKQNKLRNTVHRDIRKEIKTEALETYAAIACQCVMENPDDRPDMATVVEELEKALRLQGGEVTYVQIPSSGAIHEAGKEPEKENILAIEEDVKDLLADEKVDDTCEKNTLETTNTESELDTNHIEDANNENSNDTENEMLNDSNSTKESNITVENEETTSKIAIKDAHSETSIIDRETTEITTTSESSNGDTSTSIKQESVPDKNHIDDAKNENNNNNPATQKEILKDSSFIKESNITVENEMSIIDKEISEENKEVEESMKMTATLESSNGDTSTSTSQEVHESKILMPDSGSFSEVNEDELERLRIPFEEIKFGQKIDVRGYGAMFEGEYNHQQVALKRLNITNLHNIKPKLLSAILIISRFRQHPNLVALIGFCDESNKELILVYEYVSGGNLADMMSKHLTTIQRHQICLGAARGLEYLHSGDESVNSNPFIIHGNLKLSKILLNYDSVSSNFEAKVSGFGLPKLLPGQVEIGPKFTGKLTKESDVYTFGVLLLEVLCGVPELVDTDDYQERHVTKLVPKRLEQNMLRKIVHFDIRDEITTESLETYAKIACRCVRENPEERPTMSEVVVELEKALRLQGGKVSNVQTFGSSNGNIVPEVSVGEDDHKGDGNDETANITEKEYKGIEETIDEIYLVEERFPVPISGSNNAESVPEDAETKNGNNKNDPESTEQIKINLNSNEEESYIIGENEVDNESKITTSSSKSDNGDDSNPAMGEKVSNVQLLASSNGNSLNEVPVGEDDLDNDKTMSSNIKEKESKVMEETTDDTALFSMQDRKVSDVQLLGSSNGNDLLDVSVGEDEQECDDNGERMSLNTQEESKESVPNKNHIEDANNESSNNDPTTQKEILNDLNFIEESDITVENEKENKSKIAINDADNEISTIDQETTKEIIDDFDSNNESKIIKENKEDDKILKITTPESSNGDTSTSTSQVSDRGSFSEVNEDELERLRIPFEEIKFGQKIDVRGYGTMFEGEYNHQQVALKRLNITNLHNIKPKLLSAILTISRFRQHSNLVAIIGFCDESNKELILVYEYVSGGNLADMMSKHLTTIQRHQICLGAARGLEYLHSSDESVNSNPCIIHGNLKLSKILLNYDLVSSKFDAKVSGFGLPKLLPGHVEIGPKTTGKLTKESDVYTFGVLLLEVLCGVPELVDTDDYQERHVTELVPKRLEQNLLRKIVHFDIRDEITTESLETYAKIACRCVRKNPDERPSMPEVVVELEKALRLQGGKVSDVQIFGSSNGNVVPEVPVGEHGHKGEDNGETTSITEKESKGIEETIDDINLVEKNFPIPISGSNNAESVPEDAETKNGNNKNDPESTEQIKINLTSNEEESNIIGENEVDNESKSEKESDVQMVFSNSLNEVLVGEDALDNDETMSSNITEKASKLIEETVDDTAPQEPLPDETSATNVKGNGLMMNSRSPHTEQIMEVQNSVIPDGNEKAGSLNTGTTELIVNIGGDFSNSATQTQICESRRSNSTCSQSSNGDDTTPSDYLLPKSPDHVKKTSRGSGNCCYCFCSCSWLRFISDRVVLYGGLFWNKLISCFTWMTGQCSSKRD